MFFSLLFSPPCLFILLFLVWHANPVNFFVIMHIHHYALMCTQKLSCSVCDILHCTYHHDKVCDLSEAAINK